MIGGSLFYDFARVGATPAPFQSFVLSAGVVTDYVYGAGMHWQGGCGGFPCDGSGSLNEWNVIGELKAATPLGGGNTLNGYIGAGAAIFWPSGHPTGGTTSFLGARPRRPCAFLTNVHHRCQKSEARRTALPALHQIRMPRMIISERCAPSN
jgi:hypothetical protein